VIRRGCVDRATGDACHPANVWQHCMFPDSRPVPSKTLEDVGTSPPPPADLRQIKGGPAPYRRMYGNRGGWMIDI